MALSCVMLPTTDPYSTYVMFCLLWGYLVLYGGIISTASHSLEVLLCILSLCVTPCGSRTQSLTPGCNLYIRKPYEDYEYFQAGDVMIGGVFTVNIILDEISLDVHNKHIKTMFCARPFANYYENILTFLYAVEEINNGVNGLPNLTLGYHLFDSCRSESKAIKSVFQILSGPRNVVPNYSCMGKPKVVGFIGDLTSATTLPMAQLLEVYKYSTMTQCMINALHHLCTSSRVGPQKFSYGSTDSLLSNINIYPRVHYTQPHYTHHYSAISHLLKYFGWTWVGIITSDAISGTESQMFKQFLTDQGICVESIITFHDLSKNNNQNNMKAMRSSSANVIILSGTISQFDDLTSTFNNKTVIFLPSWDTNNFGFEVFHGGLIIEVVQVQIPNIKSFIDRFHPSTHPEDKILEDLWILHFFCMSRNALKNDLFSVLYYVHLHNCSEKERMSDFQNFKTDTISPRVYFATHMMVTALKQMIFTLRKRYEWEKIDIYQHKSMLHKFLRNVEFVTKDSPHCTYKHGELHSLYRIKNLNYLQRNQLILTEVGLFMPRAQVGEKLIINTSQIVWKSKDNKIPISQCSENCIPGYRKAQRPGIHACCYDCVQCSEGEISNVTDIDNCWKCPETEWPDEHRVTCVPKMYDFLSYQTDIFAHIFTSISIIFTFITILILRIFVLFRLTPVVKANNLNMSFLLLGSIMLSFLCVFLFLGRPVDITCMLRQTIFSIIFSVSVSSLLSKTVMVYIAFKATKPESSWRKLVGLKVSNSIVLICSCVQVLINVVWLSTSPPFQEFDMHSYPGKILVQCNEGSVVAFYSALGYMAILAAVSFVLAFMVRTLPDSFNEAKYITFSMLLFCSVWIAMIPAYLSTKGKDMVSVEIFAILASSAGLLGCIFFPKCFILLFKPETNTRKHVLEKNKS